MAREMAGFDKEVRSLIRKMEAVGWTGRLTKNGHWMGRSPDGGTSITVGPHAGARSLANTQALFVRWLHEMMPTVDRVGEVAYDALLELGEDYPQVEILTAGLTRKIREQTETLKSRALAKEEEVAEQVQEEPLSVVDVRPWYATRDVSHLGANQYDSAAVLQETWSDDTVTYRCSSEGCQYRAAKPRSVASHFASKHSRGKGPQPVAPVSHIDPTREGGFRRSYQPSKERLESLIAFLEQAEAGASIADLAFLMLSWQHDRQADSDPIGVEPLSDEVIVGKIRALVGQPLSVENARLRDELDTARELIAARTDERDAVAATLADVERDLAAVQELFAQIGRKSS